MNTNTIKAYAAAVAAVTAGEKASKWLTTNGIAGCRAVAAAFDGELPTNGRPSAEIQAVMDSVKPLYVAAGLAPAGVTTRIKRDRWIAAMAVKAGDDFIARSDAYSRLNSIVTQDNGSTLAAAIVSGKATVTATERAILRKRAEKRDAATTTTTTPETVTEETTTEETTAPETVATTTTAPEETTAPETREPRPESAPAERVALETMTDADLLAAWQAIAAVVADRMADTASTPEFVREADRAAGNVRAAAHKRGKADRAAAAGE
jgi:hypothetical protein